MMQSQGSFTVEELKVYVQGMVDDTPLRMKIHYIDGKSIEAKASYGGAQYASLAFNTKLDEYFLKFRKVNYL